jgi:hypothetical protein
MAVPANLDHLRWGGLANVSLGSIHRFQAHLGAIATVTSNTAESLRRVDIRLVQFRRLRQIVHAKRRMTDRASLFLRLRNCDARRNGQHGEECNGNRPIYFAGLQSFHSLYEFTFTL